MSQQPVETSASNASQIGSDKWAGLALAPQTLEIQIQAAQSRLEAILRSGTADGLSPDLQIQLQQTLGLLAELQTSAVHYQNRMVQAWRDQQVMQLTQRLRQSLRARFQKKN